MQVAIATANLLIAKGDYVIDSIMTEYNQEWNETGDGV
jgi:hypothetical protein